MKTILIADDEYALLDAVEMILATAGYRVVTALNGLEAMRVIEKTRLDLIILDVMMPELGGFDVLLLIHARIMRGKLPVIMMSGAYPDKKQKDLGWSTWLDKPFHFDDLLKAVDELIGPAKDPPKVT